MLYVRKSPLLDCIQRGYYEHGHTLHPIPMVVCHILPGMVNIWFVFYLCLDVVYEVDSVHEVLVVSLPLLILKVARGCACRDVGGVMK